MTARIVQLREAALLLERSLDEVARLDGPRTWRGPAADRFRGRRARVQQALRADADRIARRAAAGDGGPDAA